MRKSAIYKSAAIAVAMLSGQYARAGVNPVVVQSWETGTNVPNGTDVGWYGNVPNAGSSADGTATNNVGWELGGGGVTTNSNDALSVAVGSPGSPAIGATDGVNSLQVVASPNASNSSGYSLGANYQVNSSFQAFQQGMNSSNLIEFDVTLATPLDPSTPAFGINVNMAYKGNDGGDIYMNGYDDSDNRDLSDPGFSTGPTGIGTHTSIFNYGAKIQDFNETGLENTLQRFYARIDLATNLGSATSVPLTFYIDNLRFVSRAITWTGGGTSNNLSETANWNGVTSRDDSGNLHNLQADSDTNHPMLNDVLHFAGTTRTTVSNDMGTFALFGAYAENSEFGGLVFDAGAGAFTITGNPIDLAGDGIIDPTTSGDIINNSTNAQTINVPIRLVNNATIKANSGSLVFSQPISQITVGGSGIALGPYGVTFAGAGSTTLSAANTWTSFTSVFTTLNMTSTSSIATTANTVGTGGIWNVSVGATPALPTASIMTVNGALNFSNSMTGIQAVALNTIALNTGGKVTLNNPGAGHIANRLVLVTPNLNFSGTAGAWVGLVDLTANDLIVQGVGATGLTNVRSQIKQGFGNGTWNGTGGIMTSAAVGSSPKTALGYGTITGTFDGQAVTASDVVVKYTLSGDATLDGSVNFSDLLLVAQHYNGTNTLWQTGDFNYDGTTNFSDLLSLAQNYNKNLALTASQVSSLDAAGGASFSAAFAQAEAQVAVPEPTTLSLLGIGSLAALKRRRRNK